jgi:hypothetical protein
MKAPALAIIIALVSGLLLLLGTAEAKATRIEYTATQTCTSTSPGEMTFPDGNIHIRGATSTCNTVATLPDGNSVAFAVTNANLDSTGSGLFWGKVRIETTGGTVFEGTLRGTITAGTTRTYELVAQALGLPRYQIFVTAECHAVSEVSSECTKSGVVLVP